MTTQTTPAGQDLTKLTDHQLLNQLSPLHAEWQRRHPRPQLDIKTPGGRYSGLGPVEDGEYKIRDHEEGETFWGTTDFAEALRVLAALSEATGDQADKLS